MFHPLLATVLLLKLDGPAAELAAPSPHQRLVVLCRMVSPFVPAVVPM